MQKSLGGILKKALQTLRLQCGQTNKGYGLKTLINNNRVQNGKRAVEIVEVLPKKILYEKENIHNGSGPDHVHGFHTRKVRSPGNGNHYRHQNRHKKSSSGPGSGGTADSEQDNLAAGCTKNT